MTTEAQTKVLESLADEDRDALTAALQAWRKDGNENPMIPLDYDADGDGVPDAWALDKDDNLILTSCEAIDLTVYRSDGDDVKEA